MTDTPDAHTDDPGCGCGHETAVKFHVTHDNDNNVELVWNGDPNMVAHVLAVGVHGYTRQNGIDWATFLHTVAMTVDAIDQAVGPDVTVPDPDWFGQPTTGQE